MLLIPLIIFGAGILQSMVKDMEGSDNAFTWILRLSVVMIIVLVIVFTIVFIISVSLRYLSH